MRLIDADVYCATICRCNMRACDRAKCPIHNAPTAYSVDKVIKELRRGSGNGYRDVDGDYVPQMIDTEKAIEIVKHGVVSDDACEWKKSKDYPFDWLVGCDGCEVNHRQGDYCPRCGKKIKVVE